jgi:GNAT superfamily N-acetyltransferase
MTTAQRTTVIEQLSEQHVAQLVQLYAGEWWTSDRTLEDVRLMLEHTPITLGLVDAAGDDELVGFVRVVTDRVYYATVLDVIVRPDRRGEGHGDTLLASVVDHPELRELRRGFQLKCRDEKIPFYERWGFEVTTRLPAAGGQTTGAEMQRPAGVTRRPAEHA